MLLLRTFVTDPAIFGHKLSDSKSAIIVKKIKKNKQICLKTRGSLTAEARDNTRAFRRDS